MGLSEVSWVSCMTKASTLQVLQEPAALTFILQTPPCGVAGNVVLYNVALLAQYGASALSAVWDSGSFWSGPQPFSLHMQSVRPSHGCAASLKCCTLDMYYSVRPPCAAQP